MGAERGAGAGRARGGAGGPGCALGQAGKRPEARPAPSRASSRSGSETRAREGGLFPRCRPFSSGWGSSRRRAASTGRRPTETPGGVGTRPVTPARSAELPPGLWVPCPSSCGQGPAACVALGTAFRKELRVLLWGPGQGASGKAQGPGAWPPLVCPRLENP